MIQGVDLCGEVKETKPQRKRVGNGDESQGSDTMPDDLFMSRMKFSERRMEVRTSDVHMLLDDL